MTIVLSYIWRDGLIQLPFIILRRNTKITNMLLCVQYSNYMLLHQPSMSIYVFKVNNIGLYYFKDIVYHTIPYTFVYIYLCILKILYIYFNNKTYCFSHDFLVFLTGQEEIETVMSKIKQLAKVSYSYSNYNKIKSLIPNMYMHIIVSVLQFLNFRNARDLQLKFVLYMLVYLRQSSCKFGRRVLQAQEKLS